MGPLTGVSPTPPGWRRERTMTEFRLSMLHPEGLCYLLDWYNVFFFSEFCLWFSLVLYSCVVGFIFEAQGRCQVYLHNIPFLSSQWITLPFTDMRSDGLKDIMQHLYDQSVRKVWKFGRNLDIWVPMAAAPAPVSQQGEEFDVSFSKPVDSCTTSPEAISEPANLSLRKSFACHKIKRILEWW